MNSISGVDHGLVSILASIGPFSTLSLNLILEYATLTPRRSSTTHILLRSAFILSVFIFAFGVRRLGLRGLPVSELIGYLIGVMFLIPCLYLFSESTPQKVFLFFMDWGTTTFLWSFSAYMTELIRFEPIVENAIVGGLYLGIFIFVIPIYIKYWRNGIRRMLLLFEYGKPGYAALPILNLVLLVTIFGPRTHHRELYWFAAMLLFECLVILTYYLLFSYFHVVYERMRTAENFRNAERQLELQKKYYGEVEKGIKLQRKIIHDTRHHLAAISALVKAGDNKALAPYIDQLILTYGQQFTERYCENNVANAIIGGYVEIAQEKGISVSTEIDLPPDIGVDEYELCALFGNAIEFSIEACQRIPADSELYKRRFVSIKSKTEQNRLIVRIENSFKDNGELPAGSFPSSKGTFGGVGLESVKTVVERCQGALNCEIIGDVFALSAVLYPRRG
jgi:hypothetical protein